MKVLVHATILVALSSTAFAGASRDARPQADTTVAVIADAGRLSSAGLSTLNDGSPWAGTRQASVEGANFSDLATQVDTGPLLIALCLAGLALSRPVARLLRRQEQQRRASALASTLGHQPRR
ncbi:hypothetical protein [Roseateles sp.]|uniref:hypothetical protein n=1 Tax=Roseateles sp. TaxID=1971397 RepID=UPI003266BC62